MHNSISILTLIPARGGSKGIPQKNIKLFNNKPLIAWTINCALESNYRSRVIVSTDDQKIADISLSYGAEVPFLRPEELARDETPTVEVVNYTINKLRQNENYFPDLIMLLQPTSPLRKATDIDQCIEIMQNKDVEAVVSLKEVSEIPYWMQVINEEGFIRDLFEEGKQFSRRQDVPKIYMPNGAIYLIKAETLLEKNTFSPEKSLGYIMPKDRAIDIDDETDFMIAEFLMKNHCCS